MKETIRESFCAACGNFHSKEQAHVEIGDRIYYTGDMANPSDWGTVLHAEAGDIVLAMDTSGYAHHLFPAQIGNVYRGHCDPRFVTAKAVLMYHAGLNPK